MSALKVFLSWSGVRSRAVAELLHEHLGLVVHPVEVFMSGRDIEGGEPWLQRIEDQLVGSDVGIICVTPENMNEPWLLYEAGFLRHAATNKRVIPYLLGFDNARDLPQPLGTLQASLASEQATKKMLLELNEYVASPRREEHVLKSFEQVFWPAFSQAVEEIPATQEEVEPPKRSADEVFGEVLELLRDLHRRSTATVKSPSALLIVEFDRPLESKERESFDLVMDLIDPTCVYNLDHQHRPTRYVVSPRHGVEWAKLLIMNVCSSLGLAPTFSTRPVPER